MLARRSAFVLPGGRPLPGYTEASRGEATKMVRAVREESKLY